MGLPHPPLGLRLTPDLRCTHPLRRSPWWGSASTFPATREGTGGWHCDGAAQNSRIFGLTAQRFSPNRTACSTTTRGNRLASFDRGTKRQCLHCGTKFYDLNRDPILCPSCGKVFLLTEARPTRTFDKEEEEVEEVEVEKEEAVEAEAPEIVSLEDADAEEAGDEEEIPDVEDVEEVEDIGDDEEDAFLEEDEDDDDIDFDVGGGEER